jgi:hypothetical protein
MAHVEGYEASAAFRGGRRKFREAEDIALLKEALAHDAHVCRRGKMAEKFEEVASSLSNSNSLPWITNGKHYTDRFKLLVANFRRTHRALSSASGVEEEYGEKYQLLSEVVSAIDENEDRGRLKRDISAKRDERLAKAGQEVSVSAMKRRIGERSELYRVNGEVEEEGSSVPPSHDSDGANTPTDSRRRRKRHKHSALELKDLLVLNQDKKAE